jgi:hypothetical protein
MQSIIYHQFSPHPQYCSLLNHGGGTILGTEFSPEATISTRGGIHERQKL